MHDWKGALCMCVCKRTLNVFSFMSLDHTGTKASLAHKQYIMCGIFFLFELMAFLLEKSYFIFGYNGFVRRGKKNYLSGLEMKSKFDD